MSQIPIETPTGSQAKVDAHNVDGAAHADIRALIGGGSTPDATTSVKGKVQLAGDLAGTAAAPTVPALAAKAADSAVVHNTGAETVAGVKTFSSSPVVPTPTTGTQAVNKTYADGLVVGGAPDATTSSKGIVQLAGDLAGTAALPTVPGLAAKAADSAVVHNTGVETIAGVKTFSSAPVVPAASFPESAVTNLVSDLAAKQPLDSDLTTIAALPATTGNVIQSVAGAWASQTPAQVKTSLVLAKADVGLGNVDNTSDATKNAATATLTNKTLTSPVINSPTGIVEADITNLVTDLAAKVPKSVVTAKGDLLAATASAAVSNLAVGADGFVLTADSSQATGVKWATAGGGGSVPSPAASDEGRSLAVVGGSYTLTPEAARLPLKRFRQALAGVDTAAVNWWALGDSITEGTGGSKLDNGFVYRMLRTLQKRVSALGYGGFGYLNTYWTSFSGSSGSNNYWTMSGGGSDLSGTTAPFGAKKHVFATSETATLTFFGTSFKIHHRQGDVTSVPFTVVVDGGSPTTVTPGTTGGGNTRGVYTSSVLARGSHTVVVAPVGGNTMIIYGATLFDDDETGGLHVYNDGVFGQTSTQFLAGVGASFTDAQTITGDPALVTINLGTNDFSTGVNPTTTGSNLTSTIANVKAACTITPSFLLMVPAQKFVTSPAFAWSTYVAAIKAVAAADPTNVTVLDLSDHFIDAPTAGNSYTHGLINTDQTHPTDAGHAFTAELCLDILLGGQTTLNPVDVVRAAGIQNVTGVKTFTVSPIVPTPTTAFQAATKGYADLVAAGGGIPLSTITTKGDLVAGTASATVARVGAGANGTILVADSTQTAGVKWAPVAASTTVTLTDAATILVDASLGKSHKVTVAASGHVLGKPSNGYDGQVIIITVAQDATGSRTWTLATGYSLASGTTVTPSTAALAKDKLVVQYESTPDLWYVLGFQAGF